MELIVLNPVDSLALAGVATKTAVRPSLGVFDQWFDAATGIEVNVATECPVVASILHQKKLCSDLVKGVQFAGCAWHTNWHIPTANVAFREQDSPLASESKRECDWAFRNRPEQSIRFGILDLEALW